MTSEQALKKYFGYDHFRPMQKDIIEHILQKKDCIVLMPTGGGKSICYQIPAIISEGTCIVVSPLIALMKDQVEALKRNQVPADFINSSQTSAEISTIESRLINGQLKLLYVSPEKLVTQDFQRMIQNCNISFFAIDEAHCISGWGHDFRPEYTQLSLLKRFYPDKSIVALTATADILTRQDISQQLLLENPPIFVSSFDRPNIKLIINQGIDRIKKITQYLKLKQGQSGIIYCLSRASTESIAQKLCDLGFRAEAYHAKLDSKVRSGVQERFLKDETQIICATIAFGMGIDKPNVRFVIHYNLPRNIESYYQEIGRAGRDGLESDALLFYSFGDVITWTEMIKNPDNSPNNEQIELKLKKLERLQQFTEAQICRRRILLSYFNEDLGKDCGNCDVCLSPRQTFDGTLLAQKALSAHIRMKNEKNELASMNVLVDVLRGSHNQYITAKKLNEIKTFGAGKDISGTDWRDYIIQMLNLGVFEIAYNQNYALRPGFIHNAILQNKKNITLAKVNYVNVEKRKEAISKPKSKTELLEDDLLDALKKYRKELAEKENIAPHLIFGDATLVDMTKKRPLHPNDFKDVSGVSDIKVEKYARGFVKEIIRICLEHYRNGFSTLKGATYLATLDFYQQGITAPDMIAKKRSEQEPKELSSSTIESHLIVLYERGYKIDRNLYISEDELKEVIQFFAKNPNLTLMEGYEKLNGRIKYFKMRWGQTEFLKLNKQN
ncbi:MAG: DNA helicase RecQ [Cytophagia bacterium]|nr:MAG: DNA helicase RecQ [Cytophagales bacterium]TAG00863.1 MAG: DNA helicase RecQ [Cytophagia bacterium]TAG43420.1 MAG: DNA helicase RecQ [Cytophagia bacterium]